MNKKKIPDEYFESNEFLVDETADDSDAIGVLGKNPSTEQLFKYELCTSIASIIKKRQLSYLDVEKITEVNPSEISRIINHHLDRFTIDRLIKIHNMIAPSKIFVEFMKDFSSKLEKLSA